MTEEQHDTSMEWIKFFFVCFILVVFGLGLYACFNYKVNEAPPAQTSGH